MRFSLFALPLLILSGLSLATPTRNDQGTPARTLGGDLNDVQSRADNAVRGDGLSSNPTVVRRSFMINISLVTGRSFALSVNPTDTFATVKDDIERVEGVPPANQRLIWQGKAPSDSQTLDQAGVVAGSTIYLVLALGSTAPTPSGSVARARGRDTAARAQITSFSRRSFQITISTVTGKTFSLTVNPGDTIAIVKGYIEESQGIPPDNQRLIYGGKQLADAKTLTDYGIGPGATVTLVLALGAPSGPSSTAPTPSGAIKRVLAF